MRVPGRWMGPPIGERRYAVGPRVWPASHLSPVSGCSRQQVVGADPSAAVCAGRRAESQSEGPSECRSCIRRFVQSGRLAHLHQFCGGKCGVWWRRIPPVVLRFMLSGYILWFRAESSTRRAERHASSLICGQLLHRVWIDFRFRWIHADYGLLFIHSACGQAVGQMTGV